MFLRGLLRLSADNPLNGASEREDTPTKISAVKSNDFLPKHNGKDAFRLKNKIGQVYQLYSTD